MEGRPLATICIVGAGFMGGHIGLHCAVHGYTVRFAGRSSASLERTAQSHARELDSRVDKGQITTAERAAILSRIRLTDSLAEAVGGADLVIEAITERLDLKRALFADLDRLCPQHTILASNSSSIRISAIEDATQRLDRLLTMHFYPPLWQRAIVELMGGTNTSSKTMEAATRFARSLGLAPLLVRKESTGFIFNRVWRAVKKECLHLVDDGVASHEDVDRAWMTVLGTSTGPFTLMDLIGLDVVRDIEMEYYRQSGDPSDAPPQLLLDKIARGELGVKSGKGFYSYPNPAFAEPGWLKGENKERIGGA